MATFNISTRTIDPPNIPQGGLGVANMYEGDGFRRVAVLLSPRDKVQSGYAVTHDIHVYDIINDQVNSDSIFASGVSVRWPYRIFSLSSGVSTNNGRRYIFFI